MTKKTILSTKIFPDGPTQVLIARLAYLTNREGLNGFNISNMEFNTLSGITGPNCYISADISTNQSALIDSKSLPEIVVHFELNHYLVILSLPGFERFCDYCSSENNEKREYGRIITNSAVIKFYGDVAEKFTTIRKYIID